MALARMTFRQKPESVSVSFFVEFGIELSGDDFLSRFWRNPAQISILQARSRGLAVSPQFSSACWKTKAALQLYFVDSKEFPRCHSGISRRKTGFSEQRLEQNRILTVFKTAASFFF